METNSLPNTLYPPPLYYHHLQREEQERGCSPPEENLDFCLQNQRYDAMATSLHWKAIVTPSSSTPRPPQPSDETPDMEMKEGPASRDGHKRLPLLVALAEEILSLKDVNHEGTPTKSKKTKPRHNRSTIKAGYSKVDSREFVRECCITKGGQHQRADGNSKVAKPRDLRSLGARAHKKTPPYPHSPACTTGKTSTAMHPHCHNLPARDSRTRLVVHVPRAAPATRQGSSGVRNTVSHTAKVVSSSTPQHIHPDDIDDDRPTKQIKTLMNELDASVTPDTTQAVNVAKTSLQSTASVEPVLLHLQTVHVEDLSSPRTKSIHEDHIGLKVPNASLLQGKGNRHSTLSRRGDSSRTEASTPADHEERSTDFEAESDVAFASWVEVSANGSSTAKSKASTVACNNIAGGDLKGNDIDHEPQCDETSQSEWDSYSDDFISESPSSEN